MVTAGAVKLTAWDEKATVQTLKILRAARAGTGDSHGAVRRDLIVL